MHVRERVGIRAAGPLHVLVAGIGIRHADQLRGQKIPRGVRLRNDLGAGEDARRHLDRGHSALRVERRRQVDDRRRPFAAPRRHIRARPLHAHGLAHRLRKQRGIRGHVFVAGAAIGAGGLHPYDVHLLGRDAQHLRQPSLQRVRFLRARPNRGHAVRVKIHHRAPRPHGGVRLERPLVAGLHFLCGAAPAPRRRLPGW